MTKKVWKLTPDKYMSKAEVRDLRKATEEKAIVDLAKGRMTWPKVWMMIDLVTKTGLRVAELASVKVEDLNLKRDPYIHVRGKGGKERDVFICEGLVKHLKKYIRSHGLKPDDYLLNTNGRKFTTMGLQQQFKRACKVAGLPAHYSIHAARHTYGTLLYEKEKDLRMVQNQLGHSDVTTSAIYAHVTKERTLTAVNGLYDD